MPGSGVLMSRHQDFQTKVRIAGTHNASPTSDVMAIPARVRIGASRCGPGRGLGDNRGDSGEPLSRGALPPDRRSAIMHQGF